MKTRELGALRLTMASIAVLGTAALLFFLTFRPRQYPLAETGIPIRDSLLALAVEDDHVWAVGHHGRIVHSADDGRSWRFQSSGIRTPLSGVDFTDERLGMAVGYGGVILRTVDGGDTWGTVPSGVGVYLTTVRFLDDRRAFAVGEWGTVLRTDDSGATWTTVTSEEHDFIINDFEILPDGTGWAVGELGRGLVTTDGGRTWSPRTILEDETTLFSVDLLGGGEIWASGMDSLLLHSLDGGETWTPLRAPCEPTQLLRLRFAGSRGYVVGRRCMLVTHDGGATWERSSLVADLRHSWLYGLFVTSNRVWTAGYAESVFRAGADDRSWKRVLIERAEEGRHPARFVLAQEATR